MSDKLDLKIILNNLNKLMKEENKEYLEIFEEAIKAGDVKSVKTFIEMSAVIEKYDKPKT